MVPEGTWSDEVYPAAYWSRVSVNPAGTSAPSVAEPPPYGALAS